MMKRFSWVAFVLATVVHICGTLSLIQAGFSADKVAQPGQNFVWVTVWSWIWWPLPRLIWSVSSSLHGLQGLLLLSWSLCVGVLFGFLVPRFATWRRQII
jgi:hypothetical protein